MTPTGWISLEGTDACFAPVLTTDEAPDHPHNAARGTYVEIDGVVQPAPRRAFHGPFPTCRSRRSRPAPSNAEAALAAWLDPAEIAALKAAGTLG